MMSLILYSLTALPDLYRFLKIKFQCVWLIEEEHILQTGVDPMGRSRREIEIETVRWTWSLDNSSLYRYMYMLAENNKSITMSKLQYPEDYAVKPTFA